MHESEAGASLIEVLVALMILGVTAVAVLAGMAVSIRSADQHRQQAQLQAVIVSAAERVKEIPRDRCATVSSASYQERAQSAALDEGWSGGTVQITSVEYWDGTTYGSACHDAAPSESLPLQQITLEVTHPGARSKATLTFVKGRG